eukprot:scaffold23131_cov61-Phaeocystis_antarctica.AAC.4
MCRTWTEKGQNRHMVWGERLRGLARLVRAVRPLDGTLALEQWHRAVCCHGGPNRRAGVGRELLSRCDGAI